MPKTLTNASTASVSASLGMAKPFVDRIPSINPCSPPRGLTSLLDKIPL
jgi:hypothetical protein